MAQAPVISRERAAVEPISEVTRLSDALLGAIRVRVNEEKAPARYPDRVRRMVRESLEVAGIPFALGDLSLGVAYGMLLSYRLAEDLTEYVWLPDGSDSKKVMASAAGHDWFRYALLLESVR